MTHERDIPTTEQRRKLRAIAAAALQLPRHRQEALMEKLNQADPLPKLEPGVFTFTLRDLATSLQLSTRTLLRYIERGELRAVRVGRSYRVTVEAAREWLALYR